MRAIATALALVLLLIGSAAAQPYEVTWSTIDSGGVMNASGGTYEVSATIGQPDAGKLTGAVYAVSGGFWFVRSLAEPPEPPTVPDGEAGYAKNRYISFVPSEPGEQTAIRVTLADLPVPFEASEGTQMWVGPVSTKCENAGQSDPPGGGCGPAWTPGGPPLTMETANLQSTQHCMDFGMVGVLHVTDCEIVPSARYDVQTIKCSADPGNEANYSDPLPIYTSLWGDICHTFDGSHWTAPNGTVDVTLDVTACLDKFKNAPGAPIKARADVEPNVPDWQINIADVSILLDAFGGDPYPFSGPGSCP